jgi:MFS family permease
VAIFVQVFLLSYLWGSLSSPGLSRDWEKALWDIGKGALAILFARYLNNTGFTMTVAMIGLLSAHSWSPWHRFKERPAIWVGLGALLAFSPFVAGLVAGLTLLIHLASHRWRIGLFASALVLPLLMWHFRRADIYIIFGIIQALLYSYQLIPLIMEPARSDRNRLRFRQVLVVSIIVVISVLTFFNRYVYRGFGMQVDIIRRGTLDFKMVAITFDDGPDPRYTPEILDILKQYSVPATFFMVGRHVEMYPDIARRIVAEGHLNR